MYPVTCYFAISKCFSSLVVSLLVLLIKVYDCSNRQGVGFVSFCACCLCLRSPEAQKASRICSLRILILPTHIFSFNFYDCMKHLSCCWLWSHAFKRCSLCLHLVILRFLKKSNDAIRPTILKTYKKVFLRRLENFWSSLPVGSSVRFRFKIAVC
jgi:hypothetical protein